MNNSIIGLFLPIALALVMFGLGLTLTVQDFVRVGKAPKTVIIALVCQMIVLPLICLGLMLLFDFEPPLAVGMMLLVASPGGTTANLFSHLAGGDVALNISLTAINSVLTIVTLPIIVSLSIGVFYNGQASIEAQPAKVVQVFAYVLVPVAAGMWVRHGFTSFADRMRRPVKITSVAVLVLAIIAAATVEFDVLRAHYNSLGIVALLLSVFSLVIGYYVPVMFGVSHRQAIATSMEIGVHNAVLAMTVAVSVLGSAEMAVPGLVYGVVMFGPATVATYLLSRSRSRTRTPELVSL
jgi:BASS family bile acid:Na+ symporter